jgi:AcrR family transcriptional regulator
MDLQIGEDQIRILNRCGRKMLIPMRALKLMQPAVSRRTFIGRAVAALLGAGGFGTGSMAIVAPLREGEEPPVYLARSMGERVLDAAIDIVAETGFASATPEYVAQRAGVLESDVTKTFPDRVEYVSALIDRLYVRRIQTYRANAAVLESGPSSPAVGMATLARQFPDPVWIAYWDILFACRRDPAILDRIQSVTRYYDESFSHIVPRFFSSGVDASVIGFVLCHFDGLGLVELTHLGTVPRADQISALSHLLTSTLPKS